MGPSCTVILYVSYDSLPERKDGGQVHPQFVLINQKVKCKNVSIFEDINTSPVTSLDNPLNIS